MADAQHTTGATHRREYALAFGDRARHRLLEQHVLAGVERRDRDLRVEVVRHDDVDGLERRVGDERAPVPMDPCLRVSLACRLRTRFARASDRGKLRARRLADGLGMKLPPGAEADQAEPHAFSSRGFMLAFAEAGSMRTELTWLLSPFGR